MGTKKTPEQAIEQCDEILELLEDLPERADEFRDSVEEKILDMKKWIEENKTVTINQLLAIDNIQSGVEKWIH